MIAVPAHRELATGTEHTIRKWFMRVGIILAALLTAYGVYINLPFLETFAH